MKSTLHLLRCFPQRVMSDNDSEDLGEEPQRQRRRRELTNSLSRVSMICDHSATNLETRRSIALAPQHTIVRAVRTFGRTSLLKAIPLSSSSLRSFIENSHTVRDQRAASVDETVELGSVHDMLTAVSDVNLQSVDELRESPAESLALMTESAPLLRFISDAAEPKKEDIFHTSHNINKLGEAAVSPPPSRGSRLSESSFSGLLKHMRGRK